MAEPMRGRFGWSTRVGSVGIWIAAALIAATLGAATAADYDEFTVGEWQGRADRTDGAGAFTHCAISADFPGHVFFTFGINRDNVFAIFFGDTEWQLTDRQRYPVTLAVDGRRLGEFSAYALGDVTLRLPFGTDRAAFDALRRGKRLTIKTPLRNFSFTLKKTAHALRRLQECVDKEKASAAAARNAKPGPEPAKPGEVLRTYTRDEVAVILSKAGIRQPDFLSPDQVRQYPPGFRQMWKLGTVTGFVAQYLRNPAVSVDEQLSVFLSNFADSCTGSADSGAQPATTQGAFIFKEGFVSCAGAQAFTVRTVALFEARRLSIFGYIGWGADSRVPAEAAAAALADTLRKMYF